MQNPEILEQTLPSGSVLARDGRCLPPVRNSQTLLVMKTQSPVGGPAHRRDYL